jgi:ABC-type Fe3+-hydroxamate transport system substrate-binding protein
MNLMSEAAEKIEQLQSRVTAVLTKMPGKPNGEPLQELKDQ